MRLKNENKIKKKNTSASQSTGLLSDSDLKLPIYKIIYCIIVLILLCACITTIFPTLWIFMSAFKDMKEFLSVPPTIIPRSFEPSKIIDVWKVVHFSTYLKNSLIIIVGSLLCTEIFNGMAGYVFSKLKPLGSNFVYKLIFYTMLLPTSMNLIPLYSEFVKFPILGINLTGTYIPLWMMSAISAFEVLLFRSFFNSIPDSIVEAARMDGLSEIGIFTRIILPLSKPIVMVVAIFAVNGAWGNFLWPFMILKTESTQPVAVMLYNIRTILSADKYMVVMMLSVVPPLLIFLCFSKYIMGGMTIGAVKG